MKKILIFGMTENMGGVESFLISYYRKFDKKKVQCDFLCNTDAVAYEQEILGMGGKVYRIPARSAGRKKYYRALDKFFREHAGEYGIIWENVSSLANIDYLIYAKRYGIPVRIIHSHNSRNMDSKLRGVLHHLNRLRISKYATDFWACSDMAGKWFYSERVRKGGRYLCINNAIDVKKYLYSENTRKQKRKELELEEYCVVGNVGRLHFQKNQLFLLDIFIEILKRRADAYLLLVGSGEDEAKIKDKIQRSGIKEKVKILQDRKDVPELLQAMDVFVFPSRFEGLPVAAIEAQAAGLPVFSSCDSVDRNVNITGNVTFLSLKETADKWADTVVKASSAFERKNLAEIMKKSGYDIDTETEKLQRIFEEKLG